MTAHLLLAKPKPEANIGKKVHGNVARNNPRGKYFPRYIAGHINRCATFLFADPPHRSSL
jgi:hypothetical protein